MSWFQYGHRKQSMLLVWLVVLAPVTILVVTRASDTSDTYAWVELGSSISLLLLPVVILMRAGSSRRRVRQVERRPHPLDRGVTVSSHGAPSVSKRSGEATTGLTWGGRPHSDVTEREGSRPS